ncbi:MAG: helix-turn-helix domain-containing protein [Spirochaetes bacterium]|nr:helix-turn-helix domain-containing protein [Spirochaetota bacterium]
MKNIRKIRELYGLSKKELSQLTGIDEGTIKQYERGGSFPYFTSLIKLSFVLRYSVDYFLFYGDTSYIKNIRLLELASRFDNTDMINERHQIEVDTSTFLKKIQDKTFSPLTDSFDKELTKDFRKNLKTIRESKQLSQAKLGKYANLSPQAIYSYETNRYPPSEKLRLLSKALNLSAHCLCTGEKLYFSINDSDFCKIMLQADHYLSVKEHGVLIFLMETLLENAGINPQKPQHVLSKA